MADLYIIHCNQLREQDGALDDEIKSRIMQASREFKSGDLMVFTGGITRAGYPAESVVARDWAIAEGHIRIEDALVEEAARSTGENIMFTRALIKQMNFKFYWVRIYHRASAIEKTRVLYAKLWQEVTRSRFVSGIDQSSLFYRTLDRTLFVLLAHIDPREEGRFWQFLKKKFRNG